MRKPADFKGTVLAVLFCLPIVAESQVDEIPYHKIAYSLNSGLHDGVQPSTLDFPVFRGIVQVANAPWLKIYFDDCDPGKSSYIKMTSLEDGRIQYFSAISLKQWQNISAYFNGDAVKVELYVDFGDRGVFFNVVEVAVGERMESLIKTGGLSKITSDPCSGPLGICGGFDDRVPSSPLDHAIGRISGIRNDTGNP